MEPSALSVPPAFPLTQGLRNAFRPKRDRAQMAVEISSLGDVVRLPFPGKRIYFLTHPRDLKHVLSTNAANYRKSFDYGILATLLGAEGLVTSEGEVWSKDRRQIQPLFKKELVEQFSSVVTSCLSALVERWRARDAATPIDVTAEMMRFTMTVIGQRVLSQDVSPDVERLNGLISACQTNVIDRSTLPLDPAKYFRTPSRRRFEKNRAELHAILDGYIDRRLTAPQLSGATDLLTMIGGEERPKLRDQVMTFFAAGHETTATALAWMFYLLARHPAVQAKVVRELGDESAPDSASPGSLQLPRYARAVIDESMRLYPPIPVVGREPLADDELGGFPIRKGATLVLFLYATHRRPDLWIQPEEFRPERFLDPERAAQTPFSFLPFSAGPRVCIGAQFAMMELQIALSTLVRGFRFTAIPGEEIFPIPLVSLRPHRPILLRVESRT